MSIEDKLSAIGLSLPASAPAMAQYTPVVIHGGLAYVSGQLPRDGSHVTVTGPVGRDSSTEEARQGTKLALLRGLAALKSELGSLDHVQGVLKLTVFVQSAADFTGQSEVADGASELIFRLFGPDRGRHARSAVGVFKLPSNASVEVELIASLRPA